jgi:hypothetical protein
VEEAAELDVVGVAVGAEAEELLLVEELPQPLRASSPRATARSETVGMERVFTGPAALNLTGQILHR